MVKKRRTWDQELDLVNNLLDDNAKTIDRIERMLESLAFTGFDPEGEVVKLHKRNLKSAKDRRLALEDRKETAFNLRRES